MTWVLMITKCVNGDGRPIAPPSKVICKECMDKITKRMQDIIDQLQDRDRKEKR